MERATVPGRLNWQVATVCDVTAETPEAWSIALRVPEWPGHQAGQHVDVRLTADDGYVAQRSYSIASAPEDDQLVLTVERLPDGEVSSYLAGELRRGDELEFRGPVGGYFVWEEPLGGPLLLIAGGSGLVPFRSMLRHHRAIGSTVPVRLLVSARSLPLLIYREELLQAAAWDAFDVSVTLTREQPEGWQGYRRRIDQAMIEEVAWPPGESPLAYVCGPTSFVETATSALVALGHDGARIRAERFGGTGAVTMRGLDGNAIAGLLSGLFGGEMTTALCTCGHCGRRQHLAQAAVYLGGPGVVVRCAGCGGQLIVVVERRGLACLDLMGVESLTAGG